MGTFVWGVEEEAEAELCAFIEPRYEQVQSLEAKNKSELWILRRKGLCNLICRRLGIYLEILLFFCRWLE